MKNRQQITIPDEWTREKFPKTREALENDPCRERIEEAIAVFNRAGPDWVSEEIRDRYLALILEGRINIGS